MEDPNLHDLILSDVRMKEIDWRLLYKEIHGADVLVFIALELDINEFRKICPSFNEELLIRKPVRTESLVVKEAFDKLKAGAKRVSK